MEKIRIALAEDDERILKNFVQFLKNMPDEIEVAFYAHSAEEFFEKYKQNLQVDALILDIEMEHPTAGFAIASELKKPVMFATNHTEKYLKDTIRMEDLIKVAKPMPKELLYGEEDFRARIRHFCQEVRCWNMDGQWLNFQTPNGKLKVKANDIVFIAAEKDADNDKTVYFSQQPSCTLSRTAFSKIEEWALLQKPLVRIHKSFMVNKNHIEKIEKGYVVVKYFDGKTNRQVIKEIPVSDNFRKNLR